MLWDEIKAIRKRHGLTQAAFARRLGISAMHACHIERGQSPDGKRILPSEQLLKKISKLFSQDERERVETEKTLLFERARLLVPKEVREYLDQDNRREVFVSGGAGMPPAFIKRLKRDLKKIRHNDNNVLAKANLGRPELDAVLEGTHAVSRQSVMSLARAADQPVDEYLLLSDYMPEYLKNVMKKRGSAMLRRFEGLSPETLDNMFDVIERMIDMYMKERRDERGAGEGPGP